MEFRGAQGTFQSVERDESAVTLIEEAQAPLLARPYYAAGDPGPIVAALAQVPEMLVVAMPFLGAVFGPSALPARTKELVVLRSSARAACRYCVETHTVVARDVGLSTAEVRALRGETDVEAAFPDPADRAVLDWCDGIVGTGPVDTAARRRLLGFFAEHEMVELTLLATSTLLLNRFCTALELPTSSAVLARLAAEGLR
jgi:AhpD family alkylhydroperoxidase